MKTRIIIFAKAPQPGEVKTRLIPALGSVGAAWLANRLLQQAIAEALAAEVGAVELCVSPCWSDPSWSQQAMPADLQISEQGEGDLGDRLARVTQGRIAHDHAVILMGTDCPELTAARLKAAAVALINHDVVIHPTSDGGYALLGLRRFDPRIFQGIVWSTDTVAAATLHRCSELNWSVHVAELLHDIDQPEDLGYLPESFWTEAMWTESIRSESIRHPSNIPSGL